MFFSPKSTPLSKEYVLQRAQNTQPHESSLMHKMQSKSSSMQTIQMAAEAMDHMVRHLLPCYLNLQLLTQFQGCWYRHNWRWSLLSHARTFTPPLLTHPTTLVLGDFGKSRLQKRRTTVSRCRNQGRTTSLPSNPYEPATLRPSRRSHNLWIRYTRQLNC